MTTISYECAKKLKEFLGESAPKPMDQDCFYSDNFEYMYWNTPAYELQDLFSKKFCEAMRNKIKWGINESPMTSKEISNVMFSAYYEKGLPAVEKELFRLMENK